MSTSAAATAYGHQARPAGFSVGGMSKATRLDSREVSSGACPAEDTRACNEKAPAGVPGGAATITLKAADAPAGSGRCGSGTVNQERSAPSPGTTSRNAKSVTLPGLVTVKVVSPRPSGPSAKRWTAVVTVHSVGMGTQPFSRSLDVEGSERVRI
jgi:hypothetical protein